MFSKMEYWKRRNANLRGQGDKPRLVGNQYSATSQWPTKPVSKKALKNNTKRARKHVEPTISA